MACDGDDIGTRVAVAYQNEVRARWHVLLPNLWQLVRLLGYLLYRIHAVGSYML